MHRSKAADISVEFVGSNNIRNGDPVVLFRKTGLPVLRRVLAEHDLDHCPRRVLLTTLFQKPCGRIPDEWGGVLPAERGVRFRIQANRSTDGFLGILLCCDGETPTSLLEALQDSDKSDLAPSDPAIVEAAAAMAKELTTAPSPSLDAFAGLVAAKAGSQSKQYWMDALCEAERLGFLWRDGKRFNPPYEPEADKPKAPAPPQGDLVIELMSGNGVDARSIPFSELRSERTPVGVLAVAHLAVEKAMAEQPKPVKAADPDELMEDDTDKLFEVLSLLKTLNAEQKAKRERRKELADSLAVVDASLAGLADSIRKTKGKLDPDALLRLAESADSAK